jgi:hypothetical protein
MLDEEEAINRNGQDAQDIKTGRGHTCLQSQIRAVI